MAQINEEKLFAGAVLNSDDAIEYTAPTDILDGLNVRVQNQENNKQGLVITLEGTRLISRSLPSGTNTVIRAKAFPEVNKAYIFTKNSDGRHRIEEFDYITETFITLYEDLTDSGGVQLLDWTSVEYIKDVLLFDGDYLGFVEFPTDVFRFIKVSLFKSGSLGVVQFSDIALETIPPSTPPIAKYRNPPDNFKTPYNNLKGKLFQFRYRYVYLDDRYSDYSPISNRPVPESEIDSKGNVTQASIISIDLPFIPIRVKRVEVSARDNESEWYTILVKDRDWFINLPIFSASTIPQPPPAPPLFVFRYDIPQRYPLDNGYMIPFFNEAAYAPDVPLEHLLIASAIPIKTRSAEVVNGSNLLLANNTNGYPRPSQPGVLSATVDVAPNPAKLPEGDVFRVVAKGSVPEWEGPTEYWAAFDGDPEIGDTIRGVLTRFNVPGDPGLEVAFSVTSAEEHDPLAALQGWIDELVEVCSDNSINLVTTEVTTIPSGPYMGQPGLRFVFGPNVSYGLNESDPLQVILSSSVNELNISKRTVKTGSSYSLIPMYYDIYGRPIPLAFDAEISVTTPLHATTGGDVPVINWNISGPAPANAAYYTIGVSKNRTHSNMWSVVAFVDPDSSTPDTYSFDITSLFMDNSELVDNMPPKYEFVGGDLVHVISNIDAVTGDKSNFVDSPTRLLDIKGMETIILEDDDPLYDYYPDHTRYVITAPRPSSDQFDPDEPVLLELIRPKRAASSGSDTSEIFYEIGLPLWPVVSGAHSETSGSITEIDAFFKVRVVSMPWDTLNPNVSVVMESFHFSENYMSNYNSFGRPRGYYDTPEGVSSVSEIRWSDTTSEDSATININRFYPESVFKVDKGFGGIQYLFNRENRLLVIQENKVGVVPVYRTVIVDNTEQEQIATSNKLLNPISYSIGPDIGIGNDLAIPTARFVNGFLYFVDPHEMTVARSGLDGTRYVGYKYTGALKAKIKECLDTGTFMYGFWDDRHDEFLLRFDDYTYVLDETVNGWVPKRSYLPESAFSAADRLFSFKEGLAYIHDDEVNRNAFYGQPYPAELEFAVTSPGVKNYLSMEIHSDEQVVTDEMGITTQLGQVSELNLEDDFTWRGEGVYTANILRDFNSPGGIGLNKCYL